MDRVTQQNASSSEELSATAEEMNAQAENLKDLMAQFKVAGGEGVPEGRMVKPVKKSAAKASLSPADELKDFVKF